MTSVRSYKVRHLNFNLRPKKKCCIVFSRGIMIIFDVFGKTEITCEYKAQNSNLYDEEGLFRGILLKKFQKMSKSFC